MKEALNGIETGTNKWQLQDLSVKFMKNPLGKKHDFERELLAM